MNNIHSSNLFSHMKHLTLLLFFWGCVHLSFAQKILQNTEIQFGIGMSAQDKRLFEYSNATVRQEILDNEKQLIDFNYRIAIQKKWLDTRFFDIKAGLGYALSINRFSRPYSLAYFGKSEKPVVHIKRYNKHSIQIPLSIELFRRTKGIYMDMSVLPNIGFMKNVRDKSRGYGLGDESKIVINFDNLEIIPSLGFQGKKYHFTLGYRLSYFSQKDKAILNHDLFDTNNPVFLQTKYEWYNPNKLWLTVGCRFR